MLYSAFEMIESDVTTVQVLRGSRVEPAALAVLHLAILGARTAFEVRYVSAGRPFSR